MWVATPYMIEPSAKNGTVGAVEDGQLYCRFKRKFNLPKEAKTPMSYVYPVPEDEFMIFPMNGSYILQFAKGQADPRSKIINFLRIFKIFCFFKYFRKRFDTFF